MFLAAVAAVAAVVAIVVVAVVVAVVAIVFFCETTSNMLVCVVFSWMSEASCRGKD